MGQEVRIEVLSPQIDATTGSWERHGWNGVRNWCKKFGAKTPEQIAAVHPNLRPLLARQSWKVLLSVSQAKGLIIQLDSDIAEQISDMRRFDQGTIGRGDYCRDALNHWMNETPDTTIVHYAVTTFAIETWLLATVNSDHVIFQDLPESYDLEDIHDWEDRLIAAGFRSHNKNGVRRLLKSPSERYEEYGKMIADNLPDVRKKCSSAEQLCSFLES